jgi:hypothetical protein
MEKISIKNLFKESCKFGELNVHTLCNVNNNKDKEKVTLNIDRLIHLRDERENRILIQYDKIYHNCLLKITAANEANKTAIVFTVPDALFGHNNYDTSKCIDFIDNKLKEEKFDTLILNDISIYISWLNLGKNRSVS